MKNIKELEILRSVGIIGVLAIYTTIYFSQIHKFNLILSINVVINVFSYFAVPLFVFISGFALSIKYNDKYSILKFYAKRLSSIIPPYIIFSLIYIGYNDFYTLKNFKDVLSILC